MKWPLICICCFCLFIYIKKNKKWCITWCICLLGLFIRYPNWGASDMLKGIGMVPSAGVYISFLFHSFACSSCGRETAQEVWGPRWTWTSLNPVCFWATAPLPCFHSENRSAWCCSCVCLQDGRPPLYASILRCFILQLMQLLQKYLMQKRF